MSIKPLWVNKYRPTTLDQFVFQDATVEKQIKSYAREQEIPHLLFYGVQGSGKTALARILINEMKLGELDVLTINCSSETSVDVIRERITNFVEGYSMTKFKIVFLDEMDYMSLHAQAALRVILVDFADSCRFICACNYENKIMPALKSRLQAFQFKAPDKTNVALYCAEILIKEGVNFEPEVLEHFVNASYPDIRKIINLLQQHAVDGQLVKPNAAEAGDYRFKLLDHLEADDLAGFRKTVCDNVSRDELEGVFRFLYENLDKCPKFQDVGRYEAGIVLIANYVYRHGLVSDTEINMAALCIELGGL